jgi:hypothetical protein
VVSRIRNLIDVADEKPFAAEQRPFLEFPEIGVIISPRRQNAGVGNRSVAIDGGGENLPRRGDRPRIEPQGGRPAYHRSARVRSRHRCLRWSNRRYAHAL